MINYKEIIFPVILGTIGVVMLSIFAMEQREQAAQMETRIIQMEETVQEINGRVVGRGPNGWHKPNMIEWQIEAEKLNPGWQAPQLDYAEDFNSQ